MLIKMQYLTMSINLLAGIYDVSHIIDGNTSFGNICGQNDLKYERIS